jgi:SRSO17 transposase
MDMAKDFDDYMTYLVQGLGHADRHAGLTGY